MCTYVICSQFQYTHVHKYQFKYTLYIYIYKRDVHIYSLSVHFYSLRSKLLFNKMHTVIRVNWTSNNKFICFYNSRILNPISITNSGKITIL